MSGINLGRRLKTAGILIPIIAIAAILPGSWYIVNLGNQKKYLNLLFRVPFDGDS